MLSVTARGAASAEVAHEGKSCGTLSLQIYDTLETTRLDDEVRRFARFLGSFLIVYRRGFKLGVSSQISSSLAAPRGEQGAGTDRR